MPVPAKSRALEAKTPARRPKCWASSRFGGAKTGFAFCEGNDLALKRPMRSALSGAPASPKGICTASFVRTLQLEITLRQETSVVARFRPH
jgi:hypothetical protein